MTASSPPPDEYSSGLSSNPAIRDTKISTAAKQPDRPTPEELTSVLEDPAIDIPVRAAAARELAKAAPHAAIDLAKDGLDTTSTDILRAAVRGAASHDDPSTEKLLTDLLFDKEIPESIRMEAALGLASIGSAETLQTLLRATYANIDNHPTEPVLQTVVQGLAEEHFEETGDFIARLIDHPDVEQETKITAIEALMNAKGDEVIPTLLKYASHADPDLREAAIWAIAGRDDLHRAQEDLVSLLVQESASWVRTNLYEALRLQKNVEVVPFWNQVLSETDPDARLAGFGLIATHLPSEAANRFHTEIVPELKEIAANDSSLSRRIGAISALGQAQGEGHAAEALYALLQHPTLDAQTRDAVMLALR